MKILIVTFVACVGLLLSAPSEAQLISIDLQDGGVINVVPTAQQLSDLQTIVNAHNIQNGTSLSREQFVRNVMLVAPFQSYRKQLATLEATVACANYQALTQVQKDVIIAQLGGSPCP
jgi:hypothetical protein